jgi:hypothetical protein
MPHFRKDDRKTRYGIPVETLCPIIFGSKCGLLKKVENLYRNTVSIYLYLSQIAMNDGQ